MGNRRIAYFVSPHGFGHAARAAAVMEAIHQMDGSVRFEVFTKVPMWFFQDSLPRRFQYHSCLTDIGLVQSTPLMEDLDRTLASLNAFLPLDRSRISALAQIVNSLGCGLVICDIAPMGIEVARKAGIPSVLVENFTWDWIYEGYGRRGTQLERHIVYLRELFDGAVYRVQTEPLCLPQASDLITVPVSRRPRSSAAEIRRKLGLPADCRMVVVTMGGIRDHDLFPDNLRLQNDVFFVIPGLSASMETRGNLVLLPHRSRFFHPDLINASDAAVGKVGYSTLAEVYHAGIPFGYISRAHFRESQILTDYIERNMAGLSIKEEEFKDGSWVSRLEALLALPRIPRNSPNGAEQIARFILGLFNG